MEEWKISLPETVIFLRKRRLLPFGTSIFFQSPRRGGATKTRRRPLAANCLSRKQEDFPKNTDATLASSFLPLPLHLPQKNTFKIARFEYCDDLQDWHKHPRSAHARRGSLVTRKTRSSKHPEGSASSRLARGQSFLRNWLAKGKGFRHWLSSSASGPSLPRGPVLRIVKRVAALAILLFILFATLSLVSDQNSSPSYQGSDVAIFLKGLPVDDVVLEYDPTTLDSPRGRYDLFNKIYGANFYHQRQRRDAFQPPLPDAQGGQEGGGAPGSKEVPSSDVVLQYDNEALRTVEGRYSLFNRIYGGSAPKTGFFLNARIFGDQPAHFGFPGQPVGGPAQSARLQPAAQLPGQPGGVPGQWPGQPAGVPGQPVPVQQLGQPVGVPGQPVPGQPVPVQQLGQPAGVPGQLVPAQQPGQPAGVPGQPPGQPLVPGPAPGLLGQVPGQPPPNPAQPIGLPGQPVALQRQVPDQPAGLPAQVAGNQPALNGFQPPLLDGQAPIQPNGDAGLQPGGAAIPQPPSPPLSPGVAQAPSGEDGDILPTATNVTAPETRLVMFSAVPKCGSATTAKLFKTLSAVNKFTAMIPQIRIQPRLAEQQREILLKNLMAHASKVPVAYVRHLFYMDNIKMGFPEIAWVAIVREPVERLISQFYYIRIESRYDQVKMLEGRKPPASFFNMTLDECIPAKDPKCWYRKGTPQMLQLSFFCGQETFCQIVGDRRALQMAKYNAETRYSAVGVLEELTLSYKVFQQYLPLFFSKITTVEGGTGDMKLNSQEAKPEVSLRTRNLMKTFLKEDIEFYEFLRQRLYLQAQAISLL